MPVNPSNHPCDCSIISHPTTAGLQKSPSPNVLLIFTLGLYGSTLAANRPTEMLVATIKTLGGSVGS